MKHSTTFEQVTPEMAKQFLTYNTNNRPVSQQHIIYLADEISQGRFMPTTTIHLAYDVDGKATMINGQHVSMAIVKANKPILLNVVRSTNCTPSEQIMLYMDTDIARKRSFSHSAIAYRLPERMNLASQTINQIATALRFISTGFGLREATTRQLQLADNALFEHVPRWEHEARLIDLAMGPNSRTIKRMIRKSSVYSIALVTMFYQPERAKDFWSQVAQDDGLLRGDPRKTLHEYLPKTARSRFSGPPIPYNKQTRAVAYCWNAFWENRTLGIIQVTEQNANLPMVLKGTNYTGNQATNYYPHRDPNHNGKPSAEKQQGLLPAR